MKECFEKCHAASRRTPGRIGLMKNEKGFSLIETVICIALLGIIAAGFLSALGTASKALFIADERETAKNLAESQMEYVKSLPYSATYTADNLTQDYVDAGYSVPPISVDSITSRDNHIQKIGVIIKHHDKEVIRLEEYKVQ
jgi:prepilin-type N-terminal cleavage/methylation domain-containing protein